MFGNVGGKLKITARVLFWLGAYASIFGGGSLIYDGLNAGGTIYWMGRTIQLGTLLMGAGAAVLVLGVLITWVICLHIYGWGELVANYAREAQLKIEREMER